MSEIEQFGRDILRQESEALSWLVDHLPADFAKACDRLCDCRGLVIVSGVGKAGLVGRKISATLSSTGTRSVSLDPLNAFHGDLGMIGKEDVALLLSNQGGSAEILLLAEFCRQNEIPIIALTRSADTQLARMADLVLPYGVFAEACPLHLAPSTSTTLMMALGDALALSVQKLKGFTESDFARYHPGGSLGRQLKRVSELMRSGDQVAVVEEATPVFAAVTAISRARCGICLVVDAAGRLVGVYSDGDFRRDGVAGRDLQEPVGVRCTRPGTSITADKLVGEALRILRRQRKNALPVVDDDGKPVGLLDIQDLV